MYIGLIIINFEQLKCLPWHCMERGDGRGHREEGREEPMPKPKNL